jgi:hypothetical protein
MRVDGVTRRKLLERYSCGRSKIESQVEEESDFKQSNSCALLPYNDDVLPAHCHELKGKETGKRGKKSAGVKHGEGSAKTTNSATTSEQKVRNGSVDDEFDEVEVGTGLLRRACMQLMFVSSLTRDHGMLSLESVDDYLGQAYILFSV